MVRFDESPLERAVREQSESRERALEGNESLRRSRGIVHTPAPLARFMCRHVDELLKTRLGLRHGLADPRLTIVDPGCGTGAFFSAALDLIATRASRPRGLIGLDIDGDALNAADEALGRVAFGLGVPLIFDARNTLESLELPAPPGNERGRDMDVVCVIGNPPWSGKSANRGLAINEELLEDFKKLSGGAPLDERKIGVLSDDYVRFLRWSAEIVRRAEGGGVLGLVTNGSFFDGPVHRGLRAALLRWFSELDLVDLGGSALLSRGVQRDENVFGVRPKVACTFGVRRADHGELVEAATLRYARLFGSRSEKLARLAERRPVFQRFRTEEPHLVFEPARERSGFPPDWIALDEWMPYHQEGIQTNRDQAIIAPDVDTLRERMKRFAEGVDDPALERARTPSGHYDPARAREAIASLIARGELEQYIFPIAYRPFDDRVFLAHPSVCHRPRKRLLESGEHSEFILVSVRKDRGIAAYRHFAITRFIPDNSYLSPRSSCRSRAFPIKDPVGNANFSATCVEAVESIVGERVSAEELACYLVSYLASERYQDRFADSLRHDYPKIPLPRGRENFQQRVSIGERIKEGFLAPQPLDMEWTLGHHPLKAKSAVLELAHRECDAHFESEWGSLLEDQPPESAT